MSHGYSCVNDSNTPSVEVHRSVPRLTLDLFSQVTVLSFLTISSSSSWVSHSLQSCLLMPRSYRHISESIASDIVAKVLNLTTITYSKPIDIVVKEFCCTKITHTSPPSPPPTWCSE